MKCIFMNNFCPSERDASRLGKAQLCGKKGIRHAATVSSKVAKLNVAVVNASHWPPYGSKLRSGAYSLRLSPDQAGGLYPI